MDEPLHHIDDLFFHELEGYQEAPSARVWDEVNAELGRPGAPQIPHAPVRSFWYLKAAMILLMMVTGYALNRHTHEKVTAVRPSAAQPATVPAQPVLTDQDKLTTGISKTQKQIPATSDETTIAMKQIPAAHVPVADHSATGTTVKGLSQPERSGVVIHSEPMIVHGVWVKRNKAVMNDNDKGLSFQGTLAEKQKAGSKQDDPVAVNVPDPANGTAMPFIRVTTDINNEPLPFLPSVQPYALIGKTGTPRMASELKAVSLRSASNLIRISNPHQVSLTASFAPDLTWSRLSDEEEHRPGSWGGRPHEDHHDIRENEKAGFAYTAGARVQVSLGKHFSVGSGLTYSASNTKQEPKKLYADHDDNGEVRYRLNCSAGYAYLLPETAPALAVGDSILMDRSNYNVQYLNIPLFAGYTFGKGRITTSIIGGTQINVLLKGRSSAVLQQNVNSKTTVATPIQGLKKITTDMLAGLSFDYRIAPQFALSLSPMSRISLTPINQSGAVTSRPGALSIAAGVRYFF